MKQIFHLKSYFTFLSRNKLYTVINVSGFSLSLMFVLLIGVYSWQEKHVDRQHAKADRIYALGVEFADEGEKALGLHHAVLQHFRQRYPEVENTCGFIVDNMRLEKGGEFYNAVCMKTDSSFFSMFDFELLQGDRRTCLREKNSAVVTRGFARRWFGTDDVLGREILWQDSIRFHVTGVVQDFTNTIVNEQVELLIDFSWERYYNDANMDENFPEMVNVTGASTFVQVREGTTMLGREAEFTKFISSFWPSFNKGAFHCQLFLQPLNRLYFTNAGSFNGNLRAGHATLVKVMLAVGLVILLFAIMNYINLTVAQSGYRSREAATHRLFGAGRGTVMGRFVVESMVLCLLSFVLAVALAWAAAPAMGRLLDVTLQMSLLAKPSVMVLLLVFLLLLGMLSGIIPALILSRTKPIEVIRGTFRRYTKMVLSRLFITLQNVITIVMLACALIMTLQMRHLINAPMGFNTKQLICLNQRGAFASKNYNVFVDRVKQLPTVSKVVASWGTPQDGGNNNTVTEKDKSKSFQMLIGEPDFLEVYGLTIKDDHGVAHRPVVYLNRQAVGDLKMKPTDTHMSDYFKKLDFYGFPPESAFGGVLNDFLIRNILVGSGYPILVCIKDKVEEPWSLTIQTTDDPIGTYREIARIYKEVFREELHEAAPFVDEYVAQAFASQVRTSKIVSMFALLAILISLLGLVAMSTYFIQQRNKEIAIRKVFGSTGGQVRRRLIRTFLRHVVVAFVLSVPIICYVMGDWIGQYSYRIVWWPWIIVAGIVVLLISFAAVVVQSWMASNENPVKHVKDNQ